MENLLKEIVQGIELLRNEHWHEASQIELTPYQ